MLCTLLARAEACGTHVDCMWLPVLGQHHVALQHETDQTQYKRELARNAFVKGRSLAYHILVSS